MNFRSNNYYIRKVHRYMGVILGIQFLLWTVGGLYFSWNDIDEVHGDHLRKARTYLSANLNLVSPQLVLDQLKSTAQVDSLHSLQLVDILGKPTYQVRYFAQTGAGNALHAGDAHNGGHGNSSIKVQLANAQTGQLLPSLDRNDAIATAKEVVVSPAKVGKVEYLNSVGSHHEYRGKPLPAWA